MTERREIVLGRRGQILLGVLVAIALLYELRDVLTPILIAFGLAYLLDPVVDRLERLRVPRVLGVVITLVVTLGSVVAFVMLVVPSVIAELATVLRDLPGQVQTLLTRSEPTLLRYGVKLPHSSSEWIAWLKQYSDVGTSMLKPAGNVLQTIAFGTFGALGTVLAALIVPIFTVYLLNDFDRIMDGARELIPPRWREPVTTLFHEIDEILSQFLRGQLIVMGLLALFYAIAYSLLGVRLAIPIGLAAGAIAFIPYVGGAFALTAGLFMSLLGGGGWQQLVGVVTTYAAIQFVADWVLIPRVVGKTVGLSELWVMLALFVGGEVFGFLGILLALPVAAVLKIFVHRGLAAYRESALFRGETPPPEVPPLTTEQGATVDEAAGPESPHDDP